jgi:hypothetical protein
LRKCQLAGLAGLASLVVMAFAAAPAGAGTSTNQKCRQGLPPTTPTVCQTLKTTVTPKAALKAKVSITVNDTPTVTVKLYKKTHTGYKFLRNVFRGNVASGTKKLSIKVKKPGKYEIKTKANGHGLVAATVNKFKMHR